MKIYTKTGDQGETGLVGGTRLPKDSLRIQAYGDVDELNAALGVCRAENSHDELESILRSLQEELFELGADLATPLESKVPVPRIKEAQISRLEKIIDDLDTKLPKLTNFVLPGGCLLAAHLHVARTVCRRAERSVVSLMGKEDIDGFVVKYINRLSDLLFMIARYANNMENVDEEKWSA